jgi:hypothetical protein
LLAAGGGSDAIDRRDDDDDDREAPPARGDFLERVNGDHTTRNDDDNDDDDDDKVGDATRRLAAAAASSVNALALSRAALFIGSNLAQQPKLERISQQIRRVLSCHIFRQDRWRRFGARVALRYRVESCRVERESESIFVSNYD